MKKKLAILLVVSLVTTIFLWIFELTDDLHRFNMFVIELVVEKATALFN
ncbi:MAG TPA: hypothetical protein PKH10_11740 [bacterium]|nr:hypothetical protein [bacterium]